MRQAHPCLTRRDVWRWNRYQGDHRSRHRNLEYAHISQSGMVCLQRSGISDRYSSVSGTHWAFFELISRELTTVAVGLSTGAAIGKSSGIVSYLGKYLSRISLSKLSISRLEAPLSILPINKRE